MQDWNNSRANVVVFFLFFVLFCFVFFLNFEQQLYLEPLNVKKIRVAMTKLRVSSHRLEI